MNLGLRWAYMQPQYSALNNTTAFLPQYFNPSKAAVIDPRTGYILSQPDPYTGLVLGGEGLLEEPAPQRRQHRGVGELSGPDLQRLPPQLDAGGHQSHLAL